ncbi:hypothetical protein Pse7367_1517 [Thalassoporum mexicanum PCC 7367]|uniref:hypothetical protein n=1 Tax=Thalassoporum mexicanum TaxID=3457544 RepID=UPI00029FAAEF|nr:hypothetical protein [Pseudanabaena sp. PCC 7367]AFY69806.1 hypothetical protein Pse7367_1517 [Pseudanabaena sp. PCC 7367]
MPKKLTQAIAVAVLSTMAYGLAGMLSITSQPEIFAAEHNHQNEQLDGERISGEQIVNACVNNQAEQLPHAFIDVPSDHWAFKAVQTMYYCGAYRQATPIKLQEELKQRSLPQPALPGQEFNSGADLPG